MAALAPTDSRVLPSVLPQTRDILPFSDRCATALYFAGSILTSPVCTARKLLYESKVINEVYPDASNAERFARKFFLIASASGCMVLSPFAILGIGARILAIYMQTEPFRYLKGRGVEKPLEEDFTMRSWNILGIGAGYNITDGGAPSIESRIDRIATDIITKAADLNCLYEVFDIQTARALYRRLADDYTHFYFHMGAKAVGVSSGIMVVSKLKINNPQFHAFSREMLDARGQHSGKGVFKMGLGNGRVSVYSTHLQHSEVCAEPSDGEKIAKQAEMAMIVDLMKNDSAGTIVLTGDLNTSAQEFREYGWTDDFGEVDDEPTWGGDMWCSQFAQKQCSPPLKLDYTRIFRGKGTILDKKIIPDEFDGTCYSYKALSDHLAIDCLIKV